MGPFVYDVGSDIYNGKTFIDEGNEVWGLVILSVIFLPMTVTYIAAAGREFMNKNSSLRKKLLILILTPIFAPILPFIMTVYYIGYVVYVLARKFFQPDFDDRNMFINSSEARDAIDMQLENQETAMSPAIVYKLQEALVEANLQSMLG